MAGMTAKRGGIGRWFFLLAIAVLGMGALAWAGTARFVLPRDMQTTPSGLQYSVISNGSGEKPIATDTVLVHYEGRLLDGTVFDSSYERGQPAAFPLESVIPGFSEGIQLMPKGSKYRFIIPPQLAYGDQAAGPIPPGSTLDFNIELLEIAPRQPTR
jgi:FKBP-type peptidyl-prolyl cis-trans isomerase FkpA/FKBP-type peptidyl-prolyl cis-trans isomerase FklB